MLQGNSILLLAGSTIGIVLLLVGIWLGRRFHSKRNSDSSGTLSQVDRERVLQLLEELGAWTSEYSGNVSDYQSMLGQLSEQVRGDSRTSNSDNRVMALLQEIMESNEQLQRRLDAAENQLDRQTRQIQSYLTEARTDGLTGLSNRRAFDQQLEEFFGRYRRGGRSFVVVLIDIDFFKAINDNHGHQAGDHVLQQLASSLRLKLEDASIVARFGGEEFSAIMDGPLRIAAEKLNDVRKQIARQQMDVGDTNLDITISIGLSEPRDDVVIGPLLRRADEALYAAKKIGRNRVYFHDGQSPRLVGAPEVARG